MLITPDEVSRSLGTGDLTDDFESLRPLIEGRVALVTGATRGIGRALALYYAKLGAVVVVGGRDEALVSEVVECAKELPGSIVGVAGDVRDERHREDLVSRAERELGPVDILVNNAGVIEEARLTEMTQEQWRSVISVNLDAVFAITQLVGTRCMLPRRRGKILNFSSILGTTAIRGHANYCASKGGIEQLTRSFAVEWAASCVNVNAIAPGYVKTRMNDVPRRDARVREATLATVPARRFGELEDVVGPALFLTTPLSDYCHGTILAVDGGYLCR